MSTEAPVESVAPVVTAPVAPASGVNEPWAKSWIKSDFTLDSAALERLPDHLKGVKEVLGRQKSFEDFVGVFANSQMLAGKKGLAPLPVDAPDPVKAERKALLDTINGVPASAKDYGITKPADLPDVAWHQPLVDNATAWAHKHSVPPSALKELIAMNTTFGKEQITAQEQYETQFFQKQQQAFDTAIRAENIPAEKANALAERGATGLGLDLQNPEHQMLMKNANVRLMAMRHAQAVGEDKTIVGDNKGAGGIDPAAQASDIIHNKANPLYEQYWNREGKFPRAVHESAVAKVNELWKLSSPKKTK